MAMSGISPLINEVVDTNLVVSTESAKILASQFLHSPLEFWLPLATSVAAVIAAIMSFLAAKKSADMSYGLFIDELNKEYTSIKDRWWDEYNPKFEQGVLNKNKDRMCGFFEKICGLYYRKVMKKGDFWAYSAMMKAPVLLKYAKKHNLEEGTLNQYNKWMKENIQDFDNIKI